MEESKIYVNPKDNFFTKGDILIGKPVKKRIMKWWNYILFWIKRYEMVDSKFLVKKVEKNTLTIKHIK
jgi:hypothetical protein